MRWLIALSLLISALLSGCGSDSVSKENDFSPLTGIRILSEYPAIANGTTNQFTAIGDYSGLYTRDITREVSWVSENSTIVAVSSTGGAKAFSPGTVDISAEINGILDIYPFTVKDVSIYNVDVSPLTPSIPKGLTQQFTASGTFSDASIQDITDSVRWSSTVPAVAVIDRDTGLAESVEVGITNIAATFDGEPGTTLMEVTDAALTSIDISPLSAEVPQQVLVKFSAKGSFTDDLDRIITNDVTWSSSNQNVATVDAAGIAIGDAAGTTSIRATFGSISDNAPMTVTDLRLFSITVAPEDAADDETIAVAEVLEMTATGTFENNSVGNITANVIWTSNNPSVATVSNIVNINGTVDVVGVSPGTTLISAQSGSQIGTSTITVE